VTGILVINTLCLIYCVVFVPVELALWDDFDFCIPVNGDSTRIFIDNHLKSGDFIVDSRFRGETSSLSSRDRDCNWD
jgi:hypothetical protein